MSATFKAVLFSALVCPGAGHLYLKHHPRATALFITTFISLWIVISNALDHAQQLIKQMQTSGMDIDLNKISEISAQASQMSNDTTTNLALLALLLCWLFGVIDSYRLGKKIDQSADQN